MTTHRYRSGCRFEPPRYKFDIGLRLVMSGDGDDGGSRFGSNREEAYYLLRRITQVDGRRGKGRDV